MPRYFFHVENDVSGSDEAGVDLANLAAAKCEAVKYAGMLICEEAADFWNHGDWKLTVKSEAALTLFELHFVGIDAPAANRASFGRSTEPA